MRSTRQHSISGCSWHPSSRDGELLISRHFRLLYFRSLFLHLSACALDSWSCLCSSSDPHNSLSAAPRDASSLSGHSWRHQGQAVSDDLFFSRTFYPLSPSYLGAELLPFVLLLRRIERRISILQRFLARKCQDWSSIVLPPGIRADFESPRIAFASLVSPPGFYLCRAQLLLLPTAFCSSP